MEQKQKIDAGLVVGVIAIAINIITVTVFMYQSKIMQKQQHASVWPYLEWRSTFTQDVGFAIEVKNNGIGPALIRSARMSLDGKEFNSMDSLLVAMIGASRFPRISSVIENRVLPAGESIKLFQVSNSFWAEKFFIAMREHVFEYEICYESIYGESWTSKGLTVTQGECD